MPYKCQKPGVLIPPSHDRRRKLTPAEKQEIRDNAEGLSNYKLAAKYGVSKRTIQFIRSPEKLRENLLRRHERGGTMKYYDKDKHRESMKEHRHYKHKLDKEGKLTH